MLGFSSSPKYLDNDIRWKFSALSCKRVKPPPLPQIEDADLLRRAQSPRPPGAWGLVMFTSVMSPCCLTISQSENSAQSDQVPCDLPPLLTWLLKMLCWNPLGAWAFQGMSHASPCVAPQQAFLCSRPRRFRVFGLTVCKAQGLGLRLPGWARGLWSSGPQEGPHVKSGNILMIRGVSRLVLTGPSATPPRCTYASRREAAHWQDPAVTSPESLVSAASSQSFQWTFQRCLEYLQNTRSHLSPSKTFFSFSAHTTSSHFLIYWILPSKSICSF